MFVLPCSPSSAHHFYEFFPVWRRRHPLNRVRVALRASKMHCLQHYSRNTSLWQARSRGCRGVPVKRRFLRKYAVFLLLDYVPLVGSSTVEPAPRTALVAGVSTVLEACTRR